MSIFSRLKEAASALFGSNRLPKSFRDTLNKYKEEPITSIKVVREPLERAVNAFANILTAGRFNDVAKRQGEAGFFHLYAILELRNGTKLRYEKNERPVLQAYSGSPGAKAESVTISGRGIPLGEFIQKTIKRMGEDNFIAYDPLTKNCQDHLMNTFAANGLLTSELREFIKQDLTELIEETPSFSKTLATSATSLAGKAREIFEELFRRRGGRVAQAARPGRIRAARVGATAGMECGGKVGRRF